MEVFLTFDDGIQDGTEEVLNVLRETDVRGTFFLVGKELTNAYQKAPEKFVKTIREIYENHTIGNHTYYHANDFYAEYYSKNGVLVDNQGTRISVLDDFQKGKDQINDFLSMAYKKIRPSPFPLARNQEKPLARLPGRNSWFFKMAPLHSPESHEPTYIQHAEPGTEERTRELFDLGYEVFGWTVEWRMSFDFHQDAIMQKLAIEKTRPLDYSSDDEVHPTFDMCIAQNIHKDRLTEDWESVRDKILNNVLYNKVVVLMHDRAFRSSIPLDSELRGSKKDSSNASDTSEADKLKLLIRYLKTLDVDFKTLDQFSL